MSRLRMLQIGVIAAVSAIVAIAAFAHNTPTAQAAPASGLSATSHCEGDALSVTFNWQPSNTGPQYLDLSVQGPSFAPGTFSGTGPLGANQSSFFWNDPQGSRTYHARINTWDGASWVSSNTFVLDTPPCGDPPPAPPAAAPTGQMQGLQAELEAAIGAWNFQTAVAVTDLQTGETISVNGDRPHLTGCSVNLLAIMQTVIDLEAGRYDESRVGSLISTTIRNSDPVTARTLLQISGGGDIYSAMRNVNGLMERIGMTETFYDHPPAFIREALVGRDNYSTALDFNKALAALWNGQVVGPYWRDYLLNKMTEVKPGLNYLIAAGVPNGVVSHKNGFFVVRSGYIDNDIGIVQFTRGGQTYAYAISFLTQAVPTKYEDIPLGQQVSSLVWQYFNSRY